MSLDHSSLVVLSGGVSLRSFAQGHAVLDFDAGQAFEINSTGVEILEEIGSPVSVGEVVAILAEKHGLGVEDIAGDVSVFLCRCVELGLVVTPLTKCPAADRSAHGNG